VLDRSFATALDPAFREELLDAARPARSDQTPDQARDLAAAIPDARLRLLDTGHTPVYEDPDAVATELLALLARWQKS
jgi:pimeloyl-ACP methyl ester carboxylesterase